MKLCPKCRTVYTAGEKICPKDETRLVDAREHAEAESDPLRGVTIAGRFKIVERIGTGGMGTVYRAEQSGLGRSVALKILKKELVFDSDTITRFHREAKAMSLLTHPNTVRVFDFGETEDGNLFLAMELLEGELITHRLDREGVLDPKQAVEFAREILHSLAEAHQKGIIHRDLKPDNIYLATVEGRALPVVKVLDFGIAKIIEGDRKVDQLETQAGTVFGTPRYMSPEQAQGKKLDARSDLYSVGVLLYQMVVGHAPFVDDDAVVVMAKHIKEVPVPLRRAAPERPIPGSLERAVARALEKTPEKRAASADEMDAELAAVVPAIEEMVKAGKTGRSRGLSLRDAPKGALFGGGAVVLAALGLAVYLIASSGSQAAQIPEGGELTVEVVPTTATPPVPLPPPLPAPVPVLVQSSPGGAAVLFGATALGVTPLSVTVPPSGTMQVVLHKDGFADLPVDLLASGPPPMVTLSPLPAVANSGHTGGGGTGPRRGGGHRGGGGHPAGGGATQQGGGAAQQGTTQDTHPPPHGHGDPYERLD